MSMSIRVQLSVMMFVQFFIWGAWYVTLSTYLLDGLSFEGPLVGDMYSTTAWGAIVAPLFVGMVADRYFSAQHIMGILHLIGAGLLYWASTITEAGPLFWVLIGYALCYMPTLALVNAVAFNQMTDPEKELPPIRVIGTLGWIVAGLVVAYAFTDVEATAIPMKLAAGASALMGVFSFFLPNTPPKAKGQKASVVDILGLDSLTLMKDKNFTVFVVSSVLVVIPLAFYYSFANGFLNQDGMGNAVAKQTLGQASEVIFMLLMPFFFVRLGVKKMLLIGMLAWVARYTLFAYGNSGTLWFMLYGGILLHGICYDFFFLTGQIYVDQRAPEKMRANAQGFIALLTYGVGMLIGNKVAGWWVGKYTLDGAIDWRGVWLMPALFALVVAVLFAIFFKDVKRAIAQEELVAPVPGPTE